MLLRLVVVSEDAVVGRRRVDPQLLAAVDGHSGVVNRLIGARLVTVDASGAQLSHEALLTAWPRLRDWVEVDRANLLQHRRFAEAAQVWIAAGRQTDDLYRGEWLAALNAWRESTADRAPLPPTEQEFLDQSNAADQAGLVHERRRTRRLRGLVAALSVLLLVAVGAVVVATDRNADAVDAGQRSLSRQLAASSALAADVDPQKATLLALGAWQAAPTVEARSELLATASDPYQGVMATTHQGEVTGIAISGDGSVAATGGQDGTLRLWDVAGRRELGRLGETGGRYRTVSMSSDGRLLAAAEQDQKRMTLWSVADRRLLFISPDPGVETAVAPDGRTFAAVLGTGQVVIRDTATFAELRRFPVGVAIRIAYSPDGALLATTDGNNIDVTRVSDGSRVATLVRAHRHVNAVGFDRTGARLVSASMDGTVRVWDVAGRSGTRAVATPNGLAYAVVFRQDDRLLMGDAGSGVYSVDPTNGTAIGRTVGPGQGTTVVAVSRDGHTVLGGGADGVVTVWTMSRRSLTMSDLAITAVTPQPGGALLAMVTGDGAGWLWDRATGDGLRRLAAEPGRLRYARFSPDGTRLATVGDDGTLLLWDPATAAPVGRFSRPGTELTGLAFSPDGTTVAVAARTGSTSGEVLLLATSDLTLRQRRPIDAGPGDPPPRVGADTRASAVSFSPDGRLLAVPLYSGRVALWNLTDPAAPPTSLDGHTGMALDAAFSPDATVLATSGSDRFVRLWNVVDGREIGSFEGVSAIRSVAFSPDGATLATASRDSVLRLWDVRSRQPLALIDRHSDDLNAVAFDEHGELISAGADGVAVVWDLDPGHAVRELCHRVDPATIAEQWRVLGSDLGDPPSCAS